MQTGLTIAALATPPGKGGVALLRISGKDAFSVADRIFRPMGGKGASECPPRRAVWGDILYEGEPIDDGILTLFPAPHSYTGEDTAEISCHGGVLLAQKVLEAALLGGARMAEAGEFTRRALISGRISLSDAEAIGGLWDAKSDGELRLYRRQSRDRLSRALEELYSGLLALVGSMAAVIDYPDEDLAELSPAEVEAGVLGVLAKAERLISTYSTGHAVSEGIATVLCGRANVGKSSLYNALLGQDAAIVTEYEGTTRDVLSASASLGRVRLRLKDTAGIRETDDPVEKIGVRRSREAVEEAEWILAIFDASRPLSEEDVALAHSLRSARGLKVAVFNKTDLGKKAALPAEIADVFPPRWRSPPLLATSPPSRSLRKVPSRTARSPLARMPSFPIPGNTPPSAAAERRFLAAFRRSARGGNGMPPFQTWSLPWRPSANATGAP
jgi:tRNA modification GTPase